MKPKRSDLESKAGSIQELRFETQQLTSFSGLVVIDALFRRLGLAERLQRAFRGAKDGSYGFWKTLVQAGSKGKNYDFFVSASRTKGDGYRDHTVCDRVGELGVGRVDSAGDREHR